MVVRKKTILTRSDDFDEKEKRKGLHCESYQNKKDTLWGHTASFPP